MLYERCVIFCCKFRGCLRVKKLRLTFSADLGCCHSRGDVAGERDSVLGVDEVDEAAAQPHVLGKSQHFGHAGSGVHDDTVVHRHHGAKLALNQILKRQHFGQ
jgi:hypothetical protein